MMNESQLMQQQQHQQYQQHQQQKEKQTEEKNLQQNHYQKSHYNQHPLQFDNCNRNQHQHQHQHQQQNEPQHIKDYSLKTLIATEAATTIATPTTSISIKMVTLSMPVMTLSNANNNKTMATTLETTMPPQQTTPITTGRTILKTATTATTTATTTLTSTTIHPKIARDNQYQQKQQQQHQQLQQDIIIDTIRDSPMQMFYREKGVFLTGGTGFFGKIIIEKLLRVTDVSQIYLLIRTKKGKDGESRLEDILNDPIFEKMKTLNPNYRDKLTIINGDCSLPALGISQADRELLKEQVNIILHAAATVRFDEKLKMAIAINVNGTKEILHLAKEIQHLKAVVHVSTAFAHCNYRYIEEKFYQSALSGDNACKLCECLDDHTLNTLTPTIIKGYPNTYTYTKVLAEDIVQNYANNLPVAVFRPGIVITTYREPITGWIDNMYGPCGIITGVASGVLRVFSGQTDNNAHIVPVDLCVNALLCSAWDIARNKYESPPIYNYVPDSKNTATWREYIDYGFTFGRNIPLRKSIWYPSLTIAPYKWQFHILAFLYHTLPALFMDLLMLVIGKKPRMLKIYRKIHKFCDVMEYFSSNDFKFSNENVRLLNDKLDDKDLQLFAFDMRQVNWKELFGVSLIGLRMYVAKDELSTIPEARKRHEFLKILHYSTLFVIYGVVFAFLCFIIKCLLF